ncbi:MAG: XisI protein [Chloracidobacterium sp.]|nr:XisI protein [Chloracidobacterium sp.]
MDKLDRYRELIESKLSEVAGLFEHAVSTKRAQEQVVFDRMRDNYLVFQEGL